MQLAGAQLSNKNDDEEDGTELLLSAVATRLSSALYLPLSDVDGSSMH